ncbi:response regulator transcription factor [Cupriavidus sp. Marseille-Q8015]
MNALLIEEHPLLRLGLLQMLENIQAWGHVLALAPADTNRLEAQHHNAELMVFGMPADTAAGWQQLEQAREHLTPQRILVLTDTLPLHLPNAEAARGICGCLPKSASLAVIEAAIRLAISSVQGLVFSTESASTTALTTAPAASRSALPATPSLASAAPLPLPATMQPDPHALAACASTPRPALRGAVSQAMLPLSGADDEPSYDEAEMLKITPRQYEVLVLLARGYPIKTVSRMLNISVATVKSHACTLYQRLKVRNKGEAVYAALQRGATLDWVNGDERAARTTPMRGEQVRGDTLRGDTLRGDTLRGDASATYASSQAGL